MEKSKIDWCDSTWNPVTGCYHECEYCYARSIAQRFSGGGDKWPHDKIITLDEKMYANDEEAAMAYPYGFVPTLYRYRLNEYQNKKSRNVFVCSMADLFGNWIPDAWLDEIFHACDMAPQHNYLFLTKNVERYCEYGVPRYFETGSGSLWYGTSITKKDDIGRFDYLPAFCNTFVSIEPILEDLELAKSNIIFRQVDWFIIGAETGKRKDKVIPQRKWIEDIVNECRKHNKPVFIKSSLANIWGEPLIQEFPKKLL